MVRQNALILRGFTFPIKNQTKCYFTRYKIPRSTGNVHVKTYFELWPNRKGTIIRCPRDNLIRNIGKAQTVS